MKILLILLTASLMWSLQAKDLYDKLREQHSQLDAAKLIYKELKKGNKREAYTWLYYDFLQNPVRDIPDKKLRIKTYDMIFSDAKQGVGGALYTLGKIFLRNPDTKIPNINKKYGIKKDRKKAQIYYEKALDRNFCDAGMQLIENSDFGGSFYAEKSSKYDDIILKTIKCYKKNGAPTEKYRNNMLRQLTGDIVHKYNFLGSRSSTYKFIKENVDEDSMVSLFALYYGELFCNGDNESIPPKDLKKCKKYLKIATEYGLYTLVHSTWDRYNLSEY